MKHMRRTGTTVVAAALLVGAGATSAAAAEMQMTVEHGSNSVSEVTVSPATPDAEPARSAAHGEDAEEQPAEHTPVEDASADVPFDDAADGPADEAPAAPETPAEDSVDAPDESSPVEAAPAAPTAPAEEDEVLGEGPICDGASPAPMERPTVEWHADTAPSRMPLAARPGAELLPGVTGASGAVAGSAAGTAHPGQVPGTSVEGAVIGTDTESVLPLAPQTETTLTAGAAAAVLAMPGASDAVSARFLSTASVLEVAGSVLDPQSTTGVGLMNSPHIWVDGPGLAPSSAGPAVRVVAGSSAPTSWATGAPDEGVVIHGADAAWPTHLNSEGLKGLGHFATLGTVLASLGAAVMVVSGGTRRHEV